VIQFREALEQTKAHAIRFKAAKTRARRRDITVRDRVLDALRVYRRDQLELRIQLGMGRLPDDALLFTDLDGKPRSLYAVSSALGLLRGEDRDAGRDVPRPEAHPRLPTDRRGCGYGHDQQAPGARQAGTSPCASTPTLFKKDDSKAAAAINAALNR
jgi:integrase